MAFDHGMLNVPLAKRGNIDAQLDAYKADQVRSQAAKRKEAASTFRANKALAKAALAELLAAPGLIDMKAAQGGWSRRELVAMLDRWSKWQPEKLLSLRAQWLPVVTA